MSTGKEAAPPQSCRWCQDGVPRHQNAKDGPFYHYYGSLAQVLCGWSPSPAEPHAQPEPPPKCRTCGHTSADHSIARISDRYCMMSGCPCIQYNPLASASGAAEDARQRLLPEQVIKWKKKFAEWDDDDRISASKSERALESALHDLEHVSNQTAALERQLADTRGTVERRTDQAAKLLNALRAAEAKVEALTAALNIYIASHECIHGGPVRCAARVEAERALASVPEIQPDEAKCGAYVQHLSAGASYYPCALQKGHEGRHRAEGSVSVWISTG